MIADLIILAVLLAFSAFFSSAETALFSLDSIRIQTLVRQGKPGAKLVQKLMDQPEILLGTILIGNNTANISASALTTMIAIDLYGDAAVGIAAGILTLLVLVFSEFMPKSWANRSNERIALMFARPMYVLIIILGPIARLLDRFTNLISPHKGKKKPMIDEEDIKAAADMGVKAGTLEKDEREMIERVLLFNDITAEDVMTPKEEMELFDGSAMLSDILQSVNEGSFSRYPIYEGDDENVIGVIHIRDILRQISRSTEDELRGMPLTAICTETMYVPETKRIDELLRAFQKKRMHMAMVLNEYGTVVGLVTIEDLLEELVGEISDESDVDVYLIRRIDKHTIVVDGDAQVSDINDFFNTKIQAPPNKTVGRIILEKLGDLPELGRKIQITERIEAVVEDVAERHIRRVRLIKRQDAEKNDNM